MTQSNLGTALQMLGKRESDLARLQEAAHAYQNALVVFRAAKVDYYIQHTEAFLQEVQKKIDQRKSSKIEHDKRG